MMNMKTNHFRIARHIVNKRCYFRLRIKKMRRCYEEMNSCIMVSMHSRIDWLSMEMHRYAQKEYWYIKKMFYSYGTNTGKHTDR